MSRYFGPVFIDDIITPTQISIFEISTTVTFVLGVISLSCYGYMVVWHTPSFMGDFKKMLLVYISASFVFQVSYACLKPLLLQPFNVIYPVGYVAPMDKVTCLCIWFLVIVWSYITMVDSLFFIILERYFLVTIPVFPNMKYVRNFICSFLIISNIVISPLLVVLLIPKLPDEAEMAAVFSKTIIGFEKYLQWQPSLLYMPRSDETGILKVLIPIGVVFLVPRVLAFICLIPANIYQVKKLGNQASVISRKRLDVMTQVVYLQTTEMLVFYIIPTGLVLSTYVIDYGYYRNFGFLCTMLIQMGTFSPVIDFCIMTTFITSYRNTVISMFCKKKKNPSVTIPPQEIPQVS